MSVNFIWHFNDLVTGLGIPGVTVHDVWATGQASTVTGADGVAPMITFPTNTPIEITITVPGVGSYFNPAVGVDASQDGQTLNALDLVDRAGMALVQQDGERLPLTPPTGGGGGTTAGISSTMMLVGAGVLAVAAFLLLGRKDAVQSP